MSEIHELTDDEADALYDRMARKHMGISGQEFLRRWDAGEWEGVDPDSVPGLVQLWIAMPLGRATDDD
ncbi:hypothetical protein A5742_27530 [Mycolicibacterium fortuitum]|uniref:Uncharacterized protein n=1 Tax=Mycolicibacterium fortuitum TaxID=1766 RepID=A0ABD6QML9_MYCFO|nr:hypothetical protein [Mycolicibacterium fortuitum]OMC44726.1 hypothetical protein A5742_27530 [Mycolicibacterium fortuitum]